jgi:LacI family transcriptional regulator
VGRSRSSGGRQTVARKADLTIRGVEHGDFSEASGARAVADLLDREPRSTAVFAFNDLMAIGAIAELNRRQVGVPSEMSVLGFDGIELGRYITPQLTSIQQPIEQLGRVAGELLIDALESETADMGRAISLEPTLLRGNSTAEPRPEGEKRG